MPPIFYRQAYEAAAGRGPAVTAFETWEQLAKALDKLTPEQRCDAVYADWLLQLNSPAHQALLQIRNLLIGQGALAANYLAELAQNADDAADGKDAEVRIVLDGDWLFVANNGRKVTSMNLLGLSRFFVHAGGKVRELSEETIGRFGIGFKSSYRIASEVMVQTWGAGWQGVVGALRSWWSNAPLQCVTKVTGLPVGPTSCSRNCAKRLRANLS